MPQICNQPLKPNPFETYRDPATGRWVVVYPVAYPSVPLSAPKRRSRSASPQPMPTPQPVATAEAMMVTP